MRQLSSGEDAGSANDQPDCIRAYPIVLVGTVANPASCGSGFLMRLPTCSPIMRSDGSGQVLTCDLGIYQQ